MGVQWTKEQQEVISLRGKNILVSAAAGSGKTAVLVERIITRLTKDACPVDVDRLLIVTYTDAAACEMRERIGAAIAKALEERPGDVRLKKQEALLHTAKITTIHSFCLSVIREYFHTIDLDPGFRIAEEGELKLLKQDVMRELLEAKYEEGSADFLRFVESFATGREDTKLEEIIGQLYEFAGSYPEPEAWLDGCAAVYGGSMEADAPYMRRMMAYIRACLENMAQDMEAAAEVCESTDGPASYTKTVADDREILAPLLAAKTYEELYQAYVLLRPWGRLAAQKTETEQEERKKEQVKRLRDGWKKTVGELRDSFFFQSPEEMRLDMQMCRPVAKMLVELVKEFQKRLAEKKAEKNLIDFRDMEQFALQILTRKEDGALVPSEVAREYQDLFEEVMIDEYQDSNLIQEAILTSVSRVSRGEYNLFMVGDVKQSIYRFRLSRPELFMEKFDTYSTTEEGLERRIDLHKNFRSRAEVLEAANAVFRQIMTKKLGKIAYDDRAALYVGASYPEMPGNETEVLVIDTEVDEDEAKERKSGKETAREMEARAVAERIHALMESQKVWDASAGAFRPLRYSDIVILTRSLAGWTDVFTQVLNREGIPAFAGSKEGYFSTLEIGWMLDYLRVLDNYRQDLPLSAVLKSPFGACTNEELARVREAYPGLPFCEAVLRCAGVMEDGKEPERRLPEEICGKLRAVFGRLESFRARVPYTAIHDLLWEIMTETGYRNYAAAMPGGEQRLANLDMLLTRAKAFEATSYKGLFHFVRYIEQLRKYDVDYGEAGIYDEQTNAVRIMSIHKSKGLEFPVVIAAGMGKRFNTQDIRSSVVLHPELGLGIDAVDVERRTKCSAILKKVIQTETGLENLGEELRVLYVAMTRAKEKMILTGSVAGAAKKLETYGAVLRPDGEILPAAAGEKLPGEAAFTALTGARTYFDWLLPAVCRLPETVPVRARVIRMADLVREETGREEADVLEKDVFLREILDEESPLAGENPAFAKRLAEQFSYRYSFEGEEQIKLKYTVSELKKRASMSEDGADLGALLVEEEDVIPLIPQFLQEEEELTGASRGSAYHKLLELLDFAQEYDAESLQTAVDDFQKEGVLSGEMAACIRIPDLLHFLGTDVGKRMHRAAMAGTLYKEQPFVFGVDAKEIYPGSDSEELVLIQGIIDVYFEEDGELVVLDYKTDRVGDGGELVEKYQEQLHLYGRALEQMTLKTVKEKVIYSFTLAEEIPLDRQEEG